jgi:hypothetical protein
MKLLKWTLFSGMVGGLAIMLAVVPTAALASVQQGAWLVDGNGDVLGCSCNVPATACYCVE